MKVKYNCEISPTRCNNCNCCILLDLFHNYKAWCTEPQILNSSTSNRRNLLTSTRAPRESCIRRMRIKRNCCILLDLFHNYKAWCTEPQILNTQLSVMHIIYQSLSNLYVSIDHKLSISVVIHTSVSLLASPCDWEWL